eukprot:scaffold731_cov261-Pinguiococcus_pyrenoidosus.AAC.58
MVSGLGMKTTTNSACDKARSMRTFQRHDRLQIFGGLVGEHPLELLEKNRRGDLSELQAGFYPLAVRIDQPLVRERDRLRGPLVTRVDAKHGQRLHQRIYAVEIEKQLLEALVRYPPLPHDQPVVPLQEEATELVAEGPEEERRQRLPDGRHEVQDRALHHSHILRLLADDAQRAPIHTSKAPKRRAGQALEGTHNARDGNGAGILKRVLRIMDGALDPSMRCRTSSSSCGTVSPQYSAVVTT